METQSVIMALAALAQESRLAIFRCLVQAGPDGLSAGKIGTATGIAPSSLSFHLKELVHAHMLSSCQQGRFVIYTANFSTIQTVITYLTENCCGGDPCSLIAPPACACPESHQPEDKTA
ncbi:MAG: helix-turn-helix transcriptional regulator [Magnetococcales bacterium]|nr:helix-turn-helix transcriptional regulator [Magnetococcales bacterium]